MSVLDRSLAAIAPALSAVPVDMVPSTDPDRIWLRVSSAADAPRLFREVNIKGDVTAEVTLPGGYSGIYPLGDAFAFQFAGRIYVADRSARVREIGVGDLIVGGHNTLMWKSCLSATACTLYIGTPDEPRRVGRPVAPGDMYYPNEPDAMAPNGRGAVLWRINGKYVLIDARTGAERPLEVIIRNTGNDTARSPDGRWLFVVRSIRWLSVYDLDSGTEANIDLPDGFPANFGSLFVV